MPPTQDWTTGPAKWAAVLVLGSASVAGLIWSVTTRPLRPDPVLAGAPAPIETEPASDPEPEQATPPASAARRININTAPLSELELLPSIGPALAARIVECRKAN